MTSHAISRITFSEIWATTRCAIFSTMSTGTPTSAAAESAGGGSARSPARRRRTRTPPAAGATDNGSGARFSGSGARRTRLRRSEARLFAGSSARERRRLARGYDRAPRGSGNGGRGRRRRRRPACARTRSRRSRRRSARSGGLFGVGLRRAPREYGRCGGRGRRRRRLVLLEDLVERGLGGRLRRLDAGLGPHLERDLDRGLRPRRGRSSAASARRLPAAWPTPPGSRPSARPAPAGRPRRTALPARRRRWTAAGIGGSS